MTKQQAIFVRHGQELHYTGRQHCTLIFGPKGGSKLFIVKVRVSGKCQIWKTRPNEFRLPVKRGLYEHSSVTHLNKDDFYLTAECPLEKPEVVM